MSRGDFGRGVRQAAEGGDLRGAGKHSRGRVCVYKLWHVEVEHGMECGGELGGNLAAAWGRTV